MGEIIVMNGNNKRDKWQERINKATAEYEQELERKKELYRKTGDSELFTPEDIDAMLYENDTFRGKNIDFSQVQKYNKLVEAAHWLDANYSDVVKTDCPPLPSGRAGYICIDFKSLSFFNNEKVKRTLAGMMLVCDSMTVSGLDEGVIHFNFCVRDIRTK